jgi:dienelactone hydrolase
MACCPPGALGALRGVGDPPKGEEILLGGTVNSYCVGEKGRNVVVVIHDIYGLTGGGRVREVADTLASSGFYAIAPDFYGGDNCDKAGCPLGSAELPGWMATFSPAHVLQQFQESVLPFAKASGAAKVSVIGFCWGGWAAMMLSGVPLLGIECITLLHPALGVSGLHGGTAAEMAEACSCATLMLPSKDESADVLSGGEVESILKRRGIPVEIVHFPEMNHGWVIRSDPSDPACARDTAKALDLTISFLKQHLG